jgi:sortase (surface protein transpeptidase)
MYVVLLVVGIAIAGAGGVELGEHLTDPQRSYAAQAAQLASPTTSDGPSGAASSTVPPVPADVSPASYGRPIRIEIPGLGIDAYVQQLSLTAAGTLAVPTQTNQAGWYTGSSVPGRPGPAVIAGHLDSTSGPAVFYGLQNVTPGLAVAVELSTGQTVHYVVVGTQIVLKTAFPTAEVYGPTPDSELRLVTCTGDLVDGSYLENLIVFARETA